MSASVQLRILRNIVSTYSHFATFIYATTCEYMGPITLVCGPVMTVIIQLFAKHCKFKKKNSKSCSFSVASTCLLLLTNVLLNPPTQSIASVCMPDRYETMLSKHNSTVFPSIRISEPF